jgi:hypothetical protein
MLALIDVNGNLVRRIHDRGQDLGKVTLTSRGRHTLVTGYR